ncbi:MAG TPA: hypothetical protein VLL48_06810, partial [Longimicrobiales bacterium]|nr:hypothetical protein [Longimicrobiales bacterium]
MTTLPPTADAISVSRATVATLVALLLLPAPARAQGTLADYRRAADLGERLGGLTVGVAEDPTWIGDSGRFWYRLSVRGGHEFVVVDAATQEKRPAFDHARLAEALGSATGEGYGPLTLPFDD